MKKVLIITIAFVSTLGVYNANAWAHQAHGTTAYIADAYNMLNSHVVMMGISAALVVLLPVYSKLLRKINTSVEVEGNDSMAAIELND